MFICIALSLLSSKSNDPPLPTTRAAEAGDDDALHLYRTNTGALLKTLYSKKYGCSCVTFTHASQAVVYASKVRKNCQKK